MRETETRVKEEEYDVEVIYCDECTEECTDDYEVEPSEVCPSCSENRSTYRTVREMTNALHTYETNSVNPTNLGIGIVFIALWPVFCFVTLVEYLDSYDNPNYGDWITSVIQIVGTALWTALIMSLLLF